MIQLNGVSKSFSDRIILDNTTFSVGARDRIALVGRNGSGKSTLFKIIQNEIEADCGEIQIPKNYRIGHLQQHYNFTEDTLLDECAKSLPRESRESIYIAEKILFGLGFSSDDLLKTPSLFSGGFQLRINLAKLLINSPNMMLLDEPTNYLDIVGIRWLRGFLKNFEGEAILISHHREFLDQVCNHTMGIHRSKIKKIKGGTAKYYEQIQQEDFIYEQTRANQEKKVKEVEKFVDRFRAKASKAAQVQSRVKALEKMSVLDKLVNERTFGLNFLYSNTPAKVLIEAKDISFSYPNSIELIKNFTFTLGKSDRVAIIGKNGKGKSTLLNIFAKNLLPTSGDIKNHPSLRVGHFGQMNIDKLDKENNIIQEISAGNPGLPTSRIRSICGAMMFEGELAEKSISILSGGEKGRVLLGQLVAKESNLLLLDEPTNHLDLESTIALTHELRQFPGAVMIVTHSEEMLKALVSKLIIFKQDRIIVFDGGYQDFIDKIGWDDEEVVKERPKKKGSKKDIKKRRSEIIKERSTIITPLRKQIDMAEERISELEDVLATLNEEIANASEQGLGEKIGELAKKISSLESEIETLFLQLEDSSEKYEYEVAKYQKLLDSLESC